MVTKNICSYIFESYLSISVADWSEQPRSSAELCSPCSVATGTWCARRASRTSWPTRGCATRQPPAPTVAWRSPRPRPRATWPSRRLSRSCLPNASTAPRSSRAIRCSITKRRTARTGQLCLETPSSDLEVAGSSFWYWFHQCTIGKHQPLKCMHETRSSGNLKSHAVLGNVM